MGQPLSKHCIFVSTLKKEKTWAQVSKHQSNKTLHQDDEEDLICNANVDFGFQGTEVHGALSVGHSRTSPVQSYKSTRTSIRQVAKVLAGKCKGFILFEPQ